jgi:hypothetical protein
VNPADSEAIPVEEDEGDSNESAGDNGGNVGDNDRSKTDSAAENAAGDNDEGET